MSSAAIVELLSPGAGEGMNRRLQRNAGAARKRRREPERRFRGSALDVAAAGRSRYIFEARSRGFTPLRAGSDAMGARRLAGCGVRLGR